MSSQVLRDAVQKKTGMVFDKVENQLNKITDIFCEAVNKSFKEGHDITPIRNVSQEAVVFSTNTPCGFGLSRAYVCQIGGENLRFEFTSVAERLESKDPSVTVSIQSIGPQGLEPLEHALMDNSYRVSPHTENMRLFLNDLQRFSRMQQDVAC